MDFSRAALFGLGIILHAAWLCQDQSVGFRAVHDFIQWLFPLPEPSRFNLNAPLLTAEDIVTFRSDPQLQGGLARSFERFLAFLGLVVREDGQVAEGPHFSARLDDAWAYPNHNWLRISRVLRSLSLLVRMTGRIWRLNLPRSRKR